MAAERPVRLDIHLKITPDVGQVVHIVRPEIGLKRIEDVLDRDPHRDRLFPVDRDKFLRGIGAVLRQDVPKFRIGVCSFNHFVGHLLKNIDPHVPPVLQLELEPARRPHPVDRRRTNHPDAGRRNILVHSARQLFLHHHVGNPRFFPFFERIENHGEGRHIRRGARRQKRHTDRRDHGADPGNRFDPLSLVPVTLILNLPDQRFCPIERRGVGQLDKHHQIPAVLNRNKTGRNVGEGFVGQKEEPAVQKNHNQAQSEEPPNQRHVNGRRDVERKIEKTEK